MQTPLPPPRSVASFFFGTGASNGCECNDDHMILSTVDYFMVLITIILSCLLLENALIDNHGL